MAESELMGVVELVATQLTISGQRFALAGRGGKPMLTRTEYAALLAGVRQETEWYFYAKYLNDRPSRAYFRGWIHQRLAGEAVNEKWHIKPGAGQLAALAGLVVDDLMRDGKAVSNVHDKAQCLRIAKAAWVHTWEQRYRLAISWGQECETDAQSVIEMQLKSTRGVIRVLRGLNPDFRLISDD